MRLRLRSRTALVIAAVVAVTVVVAGIAGYLGTRDSAAKTGGPSAAALKGWKVRVNNHELFTECQGAGSPAVILDAGLGDDHDVWQEVLDGTSTLKTRVCAYDRWGVGGSDRNPAGGQTIAEASTELNALLHAAGVQPPYILVSHSIAGLIHRYYTHVNPDEVKGLVMVDTAPDDWAANRHRNEFSYGPETLTYLQEQTVLQNHDNLGGRPTVVIQAETEQYIDPAPEFLEYWRAAQRRLTTLSTNSIYVIASGSDHNIPVVKPKTIIDSIGLVVDAVRTGKPLPTCHASVLDAENIC